MLNLYSKKRTSKLILYLIPLLAFFVVTPAIAISEYELFQEGYDLYLSCEPAKATEKFEAFLKEFPDSSAKDSVLFWLGKALMQMGKLSESERVFSLLRKDFSNSPFSFQAGKELDRIKTLVAASGGRVSTEVRTIDKEIEDIKKERDRLRNLLDEEKKRYERRIAEYDLAIREKKALEERIKELEVKVQDSTQSLKVVIEERDSLVAELKKEIEIGKKAIAEYANRLGEMEKKDNEIKILIKDKEDFEKKVAILEKGILEKSEELKKIRDENKRLNIELMEMKNKLVNMNEAGQDIERMKVLLSNKEREIEDLKASIQKQQDEQRRLTAGIEELGREKENLTAELHKIKDLYDRVLKEKEILSDSLVRAADKIVELKGKIEEDRDLEKKLSEAEKKAQTLQSELKKALEEGKRIKEEKESLSLSHEERKKEIVLLNNRVSELGRREEELARERDIAKEEVIELKKKLKEMEEKIATADISKITEERDRLRLLLDEEKKRNEEAGSQIAALKQRETELLGLNATMKGVMEGRLSEIGQRLQVCERDMASIQNERIARETAAEELKRSIESLKAEVSRLRAFELEAKNLQVESNRYIEKIKELERSIENSKKEGAGLRSRLVKSDKEISRLIGEKRELEKIVGELKDKIKGRGYKTLIIGDERFSADHISSYMFKSQLTLGRSGIKEIPWRKGDLYEDFIAEYLLYEEAKKINLKGKDSEGFNNLSLSREDMEYLNRFNLITNLINHELKRLPPKMSAEAIVLKYSDKDRYEKAAMVVDMQNQIKAGLPVKDVVRSFPDAEYMSLSDKDINELFGDISGQLSDNEVASTFNKDRFIVLKVKIRTLEYRPYESSFEDTVKSLREYVSRLILTLRSRRDVRFSD